ncbi:MAG: hypothetical protein K9K67_04660 [Bacteriovoracaceae bacterium]|nr:hypothetical protein [Bacteriovoracaceae bacterium]
MLINLQKKLLQGSLNLAEKTLESLYRDKSFLKISSLSLNSNLWLQKTYGKGLQRLVKGLNLPTDEFELGLLETLHSLEQQNDAHIDRIKELEGQLEQLQAKRVKPQRSSRIRKKPTSVTV